MKLEGFKETGEALNNLPKAVARKIVRKGLREGAKVTLQAARALAPKRSGKLKRNLKVRSAGTSKGKVRMSVGVAAKDFTGETFYAGFVLYGHKAGSRKLGDKRKQVPANDFLKRAYDQTKEAAVQKASDVWVELIQQEASKK